MGYVMFGSDQQAMQDGWNARAARNPFFYVESTYWNGDIDDFFKRGEETARLLIDRFRRTYSPGKELALDLGCGLGRFSQALARRFSRVIAVDISDEMISNAKHLHLWPRFNNIAFETNDGVHLAMPESTVDFAWSYEVLQHAPNHEIIRANIAEIARVLRPGGLAAIHLKTGYQRPAIHAILRQLPEWAVKLATRIARQDALMADKTFRGAPPLNPEQIEAMLADTGLTLLELVEDPTHSRGTRIFALASKGGRLSTF
jgi:SAM-dependent methyltransferase